MIDHPLIFSLAKNIQLGLRPRRIFLVSSEYQRIIDHPLIDYLIDLKFLLIEDRVNKGE